MRAAAIHTERAPMEEEEGSSAKHSARELRAHRLPAIEIAAQRNIGPLLRQRRLQALWRVVLFALAAVIGHWLVGLGLLPLLGMLATSILLSAVVTRLRAFGEAYRIVRATGAHAHPDDVVWWREMRLELQRKGRTIVAGLVAGALVGAGTLWWTTLHVEAWWAVPPCIAGLVYGLSSIQVVGPSPPDFALAGMEAQSQGCRIVVFRPFHSETSALARNALIPILEGYGRVDIVTDSTFERSAPSGIFGLDHTGSRARLHRFADAEWRAGVLALIRAADVAVVDITVTSPNVIWEVAQCYGLLPDHRVMLMLSAGIFGARSLQQYMRDFYRLLGENPEMPRDVRPFVFVFTPGAGQEVTLALAIHQKMGEIVARESSG